MLSTVFTTVCAWLRTFSMSPVNLPKSVRTACMRLTISALFFWILSVVNPTCRLLSNAAIVVGPHTVTWCLFCISLMSAPSRRISA